MSKILYKLAVIVSDIEHLLSPAFVHPRRGRLFLDYTRLRTKAWANRWFHFTSERFLSYDITFPDYDIFFAEFRQIFVRHTYYFATDEKEPIIVDCGGNIGMSVLYFTYLYPSASITVFEPSREVLPHIERNITKNKLLNVKLIQAAVYDSEGEMLMHPRGAAASGNTLDAGLYKDTAVKQHEESYKVNTVLLSSYIKGPITFLKLDIEGSEGVVIAELERTGKLASIEKCSLEYHSSLSARDNALSDLLHRLETLGKPIQLYSDDMAPASPSEASALCIRVL